tara:strand:+ start:14378 stop:14629 length:252 start_codon:yes stop_codon:yes gene_type:complete
MPFDTHGEFITETKNMEQFIKKNHYLVIKADTSVDVYQSLRRIQADILVDASTISKKLKENDGDYCYVTSKPMGYVFYIKKLA